MEKRKLTKTKQESYSGKLSENEVADLLVKVKHANYIPNGIKARTKVTPYIFIIGNVTKSLISILEKDANVISFSVNKKLNQL